MVRAVSNASPGEQAVELFARGLRPDVVVMDFGMPGIGGIEAIRRARVIVPEQRVIALPPRSACPTERSCDLRCDPFSRNAV